MLRSVLLLISWLFCVVSSCLLGLFRPSTPSHNEAWRLSMSFTKEKRFFLKPGNSEAHAVSALGNSRLSSLVFSTANAELHSLPLKTLQYLRLQRLLSLLARFLGGRSRAPLPHAALG